MGRKGKRKKKRRVEVEKGAQLFNSALMIGLAFEQVAALTIESSWLSRSRILASRRRRRRRRRPGRSASSQVNSIGLGLAPPPPPTIILFVSLHSPTCTIALLHMPIQFNLYRLSALRQAGSSFIRAPSPPRPIVVTPAESLIQLETLSDRPPARLMRPHPIGTTST